MFNLVAQNDQQIGAIIKTSHENNGFDVATDPMFDDFVKIGALMTQDDICFGYLVQLNDELLKHAKIKGVLEQMLEQDSQTLKTQKTAEREGKTWAVHKHYKVMTSYLSDYEGRVGFNTGTLPPELKTDELESQLPSSPATLTAFVRPENFRKYLFQYAYHWKDAGVGWRHGEFTHRIHWYIILEHLKKSPTWLKAKPLELFRACALPKWRHGKNPQKGVWDDIIDDTTSKDTFRSPETLHGSLKAAAESSHVAHKHLWFLAQLILGRAAKRAEGYHPDIPESAKREAGGTIVWKR